MNPLSSKIRVSSEEIDRIVKEHVMQRLNVQVVGEGALITTPKDKPDYQLYGPLSVEYEIYPDIHNDKPVAKLSEHQERRLDPE
jgi:hypothetical protein